MPGLARVTDREGVHGDQRGRFAPIVHPPRYYAFLSYSHADETMAGWLHDSLEKFRTPASLVGQLADNGAVPRRLTPIFRDRHELSASEDLGGGIRDALSSSRFLIVLCSPAAAASRWVNAEIDMFKRQRPDGCLLAAIVAGEPFASDVQGRENEECLPPSLRQKYDRRGRPTSKRAEPLAADLRDGRDGKRLGLLKLIAGMLGVGLDELVQRETLRRQRRLAIVAAASLAGMAVTSTLAIVAVEARDAARDQRREAEGLVGFMLGDLRSKLEPLGRLDALDSVGARALAYYQNQDKGSLSDASLAQRAKALTLMGEIANTRGDLNRALKLYREALASTAESLRRTPDNPQRVFDHAQNVFWVGYIDRQRGQLDRAEAAFRQYRRLADRMIALAPSEKNYRLEAMYADSSLGALQLDQHQFRRAAATYQQALEPAETLAATDPNNDVYQDYLIESLAWLADALEDAGDIERAIGERERQLLLLASLQSRKPGVTSYQRQALTAHRAMGRLLTSRGEVHQGLAQSQKAVQLANVLFNIEPGNTEWMQAGAGALFDLAEVELAADQLDEAATTARAGCASVDRLLRRDSSVADWKATLRVACLSLRGRLALKAGKPTEAGSLAEQALGAARVSPEPLDKAILTFTALALGGNALAAAGNRADAQKSWRAALAAIPKTMELRPREQAQVAAVHLQIGNIGEARRMIVRLTEIGYRHPGYIQAS